MGVRPSSTEAERCPSTLLWFGQEKYSSEDVRPKVELMRRSEVGLVFFDEAGDNRTCDSLGVVYSPPSRRWKALMEFYTHQLSLCGLTEARRDAILQHNKLLIEKKYALPYCVLDAAVAHFMRFLEETRIIPVIWHQSLIAFVQRYKNELWKEDKENLRCLVGKQRHNLVTPEILRELNSSHNRGEKDISTATTSPVSVINKTIEKDRFNIPEVPMEED